MKSYIIKIELVDSEPLIWRRVIMPAAATFRRLHDIIQGVTNFSSGYLGGVDDYHLYQFDLIEQENISVTNDEEAYLEHKAADPDKLLKALEKMPPEFQKFEKKRIRRLLTTIRKPQTIKIDKYLEKYGELDYLYDFGDGWEFKVILEKTVDDYYFGYPTLLDGEQTAPPEDVGGMQAYYDFLEIYKDESHPEHAEVVEWAKEQSYRTYDQLWINERIKSIHYKKTEWDKIDHENHRVLNDKYVK